MTRTGIDRSNARLYALTAIAGLALALPTFAQNSLRRPDPAGAALELRSGAVPTTDEVNLLPKAAPFTAGRRYMIQLNGPITPTRQLALLNAGVKLGDAIPQNAYIVTFEGTTPAALIALGFVTWTGEFRAAWKLDPELGVKRHATPERQALDAAGTPHVVVVTFDDQDPKPVIDEIARLGGAAFDVNPCGNQWMIEATLPAARAADLAKVDAVQFIEDAPEGQFRNDSNRWILQSNVSPQTPIWNKGIHGEGQVGGHIDGTVKEAHCSFDDSVAPGPTHRKLVALRNAGAIDSHGTHTAGTFAGDQAPYGVYTTNDGMAFAAKLSFSNVDPIYSSPSTLNPRLTDAHNDGARVHSNSWGDDGTTAYTTWCRQIDQFTFTNEDSLVAFAVTNQSSLKTPENSLNVLGVGASGDTPSQGNHCSGGTGPTSDGRRKPEVYAPGCNTTSSDSSTSCGFVGAGWTGTSMACPAVSGCGLLVRQYFTEGWYPTGSKVPTDAFTPTGALIKAVLINSAVNMTGIAGYPSNQEGWGRVLLSNSLTFAGDLRKTYVVDVRNASGLSTGQQAVYTFTVNSGATPLNVTLVSTHPAAAVNASNPVVNNLDLEVMAPANNLYKGNVFASGQSAIGGTADAKNNVEQVIRSTPTAGTYTVTVKGTTVNGGTGTPFKQGYALVVTGDISTCTSPAVTDQPDALSVRVGDPVAFTVAASGTEALSYQWRLDTGNVGTNSPIFSLASAQLSDAGNYSVVVTNACGSATSNDALLEVFCPADYDLNGFVNGDDFDAFVEAFVAGDPAADFDRNTFVSGDDFDGFVEAFVAGC